MLVQNNDKTVQRLRDFDRGYQVSIHGLNWAKTMFIYPMFSFFLSFDAKNRIISKEKEVNVKINMKNIDGKIKCPDLMSQMR